MMVRLPDFEAWAIFAKVVERGSFAGAALELGLSNATVSKAVTRLEARIGATLLHRTSRRLALSETGRAALERARRMLEEGEAAEAEAASASDLASPRGTIRMSAPLSFGIAHLGPLLPVFIARYPDIVVDLQLSDAIVDLVGGGFDLAIRITTLADSSLRTRQLCPVRMPLVATPAYLERHGRPAHPRDLERHRGFAYTNKAMPELWHFVHDDGAEHSVRVTARVRADNGDVLLPLLLAGEGLGYFPDFMLAGALEAGLVEELLPGWRVPGVGVHLVMPPGTLRPARVTAMIDYLAGALKPPA